MATCACAGSMIDVVNKGEGTMAGEQNNTLNGAQRIRSEVRDFLHFWAEGQLRRAQRDPSAAKTVLSEFEKLASPFAGGQKLAKSGREIMRLYILAAKVLAGESEWPSYSQLPRPTDYWPASVMRISREMYDAEKDTQILREAVSALESFADFIAKISDDDDAYGEERDALFVCAALLRARAEVLEGLY